MSHERWRLYYVYDYDVIKRESNSAWMFEWMDICIMISPTGEWDWTTNEERKLKDVCKWWRSGCCICLRQPSKYWLLFRQGNMLITCPSFFWNANSNCKIQVSTLFFPFIYIGHAHFQTSLWTEFLCSRGFICCLTHQSHMFPSLQWVGSARHKELVLQVLYKDLATNAAHRRASYVVEAALNNCSPQDGGKMEKRGDEMIH